MTVSSRVRRAAAVLAAALTSAFLLTHGATAASRTPPGPGRTSAPALSGAGTHVDRRPGAPRLPDDLSARSWLVADADTGEVLAAHAAHRPLPPASTLKTLFAVTTLPRLPASRKHQVTEAELADVAPGSSLVGIVAGHTYRVSDLWRGVFLGSGNDAVHVLAEMNGGWRSTAEQMQAKAEALGARDTRVVSPDGFDAPGQVSSAYDLAVFGRAGLRIPEFARYCSTQTADFPGDRGGTFQIQNTNRLLSGADGVERYPGLIGVKNGYTTQAGNTLIAAARRDGHTVLVTVMRPETDESQAVYEEARRLLDWGADAVGQVDAVGSLEPPGAASGPSGAPARDSAGSAAADVSRAGHSARAPDFPLKQASVTVALFAGGGLVLLRLRSHRRRPRRTGTAGGGAGRT